MKGILLSLCIIISIPVLSLAQEEGMGIDTISAGIQNDTLNAKHKKFDYTALPTISFDRSKGTGFGVMGMTFFQLGKKTNSKKPSSVMINGKYTTNNNYFVSMMAKLFFNDDRFRLIMGGGYMNNNFQTYENLGEGEIEIPYNDHGGFLFISPSVRVWDNLYVGIGGQMFKSHLDIKYPEPMQDSISNEWMNSVALTAMYDSKDNPYNGSKGITASIRVNAFPVWLENSGTFYRMHAEINHYHRIDKSKILASRAALNAGMSDVPFEAQSYVGGKDIRGYTKGEYRGDQTYSAQTELRWNFYKRWGMVGFFGLALAVNPGDVSPLLPGGGVGIRYMAIPKYGINIGMDGALGKDDWGLYFRITEAF